MSSRRLVPAAVALPTALVLAVGAAAYSGGCATTGHTTPEIGEGPVGSDAGFAGTSAPGPLNTGIISNKALCAPGGGATVDWSPLRRISRVEYNNMVRDLLGDTTQPATAFVPESPMYTGVNFDTNTYTSVSSLVVQQYQQAAETLAQAVASDMNRLNNTLPCQTQDDACAQQFIASFANRAFRGQLDSAESAGLFQVYSSVKAQFDFVTGIQAVITAVLESPRFLYVLEFGQGTPAGTVVALSPYEVAGRLALMLWRSVPDPTLMAAAAAGTLSTPDQIEAQAVRMLGQMAKAQAALDDFTTQWMQLQSTPTLGKDSQFGAWTLHTKVGTEMRDEALTNVSQLVLSENGGLTELLTSSSSYVNADLASFYGKAVTLGTGTPVMVDDASLAGATNFYQTDLTAMGHAGILTNGGVLATQAHTSLPSSVLRGKLVREQILCDQIPPPPPNVPPPPASVPDGGTTRSLFEAHATRADCVNCHEYMDPIGYGFGHFDATGAYQTLDANGLGTGPALDVTGQIAAMSPETFAASFDGAVDLVTKLANAPQVQECFALQEFRYALGRIETRADACSAQQIYASFSSSQLNIQKLLVAIVRSDAFRYRSVVNAGSACR